MSIGGDAPPAAFGGGALPRFKLLTSTDQGTAPLDPGGLAQSGTAFNSTTGTFTWSLADGTLVDGYQENQIRWTKRVLDLYPNFSLDLDILQLVLVIDQLTLTAAIPKWGVSFGILDQIASLASADGPMWGIKGNTAANYNHGSQGQTSDSFGNVMSAAVPRYLFATFLQGQGATDAGVAANEMASTMRAKRTSGVWEQSTTQTGPPLNDAPANWVISIGHVHDTTVNEAATVIARLYHRRIRTTGLVGLPT